MHFYTWSPEVSVYFKDYLKKKKKNHNNNVSRLEISSGSSCGTHGCKLSVPADFKSLLLMVAV